VEFKDLYAVAIDVDGVLTDGTYWWGANGEEFKRFSVADGTGITLAVRSGIRIALISGDSTPSGMALVQRLADKLKIIDVYKGCHDKAAAVRDFAERNQLQLSAICFIGDDFIDLPAMEIVGLAVAPADAQESVKKEAHMMTQRPGGRGAVREVLDSILQHRTLSDYSL
jgi:3-deoxy-D-manno-octulosonate 8-phosphate phosphatase (KDO 8-P phosphatase)